MTSFVMKQIERHRCDVEGIRRDMSKRWVEYGLPDVDAICQEVEGAAHSQLLDLRRKHPKIEPGLLEFLKECGSYRLFGLSSDDSFGMLSPNRISSFSDVAPKIIACWNSGPVKEMKTPPLLALRMQNPNVFDASELVGAIVVASGDASCDPALLWVPAPRNEYWFLASWEGCLRFARIEDAFQYLLSAATDGIRASLS